MTVETSVEDLLLPLFLQDVEEETCLIGQAPGDGPLSKPTKIGPIPPAQAAPGGFFLWGGL